jgi:hypothetical protein
MTRRHPAVVPGVLPAISAGRRVVTLDARVAALGIG